MKLHRSFLCNILIIVVAGCPGSLYAQPSPDPYMSARKDFLLAEQYLKQKQRKKYWELLHKLQEYPLYPYLRYQDIHSRLDSASESEVLAFINAYADSPIAGHLQEHWLESLARKKDWNLFIRHYQHRGATRLQCWYHQALLNTNRLKDSVARMDTIWLTAASLPDNCDPVIRRWKKAGAITREKTWERMMLAAQNKNFRLARYLASELGKNEQKWVEIWHKAHVYPASVEKLKWTQDHDKVIRLITLHAARRLVRLNPEEGKKIWLTLQKRIPYSKTEIASTNRYLALSYALQYLPSAKMELEKIPEENTNDTIREWIIRTSLYHGDWDGVLKGYDGLEPREKSEYRWLYWKARALMEKGRNEEATTILKKLALTRSYEGFLSADILDKKYHFHHKPVQKNNTDVNKLLSLTNILRARELYKLERYAQARREWNRAIRNMEQADLVDAAWLAHSWGWQDQAITTLGRAGIWNDLEIRFPLAYFDEIQKHSMLYDINPAWALAMIKQESSFMPDARSRSNARGLMQLMPSTARYIAGKINIKVKDTALLYKSQLNIKLGMAYLNYVRDYYEGHLVLATAAYNAGKGRVNKWIPKDRAVASDIWIETIPYRETRNYTRNVLAFLAVYENRMGKNPASLQKYMPEIKPRKDEQASSANKAAKLSKS